MAALVVFSMISSTTERLSALLKSFVGSPSKSPSSRSTEKLEELQKMMLWIQSTFNDADERQIRNHSAQLRLCELKDVAYDMEDVVDDYNYEMLHCRVEIGKEMGANHKLSGIEVSQLITSHSHMVKVLEALEPRLNEIKTRFDVITREWEVLHMPEREAKRQRIHSRTRTETSSFINASVVFGRDDDKEKLISILLSQENGSGERVSVIPITGMGGIGKTTVAQIVYNDPVVRKHFDLLGWVCVSEDTNVASLTRKIAMSLFKEEVRAVTLDEVRSVLTAGLKRKRILLVLDDVWIEDQSNWDELRNPLTCAAVAKVLVTTRNFSVARIMQTMDPIKMSCLSVENSWRLFKAQAFGGMDANLYENLSDIGIQIVEKCKGLPLAIKVLGAALHFETDEETWRDILEAELWELDEVEGNILPALQLSYDCMSLDLKQCFTFFSLIPKSTPVERNLIVQLWISHGLLQPTRTESLEDIGNKFFYYFLQRSILQEEVQTPFDNFNDPVNKSVFSMHDLIHDLAQSIALGD